MGRSPLPWPGGGTRGGLPSAEMLPDGSGGKILVLKEDKRTTLIVVLIVVSVLNIAMWFDARRSMGEIRRQIQASEQMNAAIAISTTRAFAKVGVKYDPDTGKSEPMENHE